MILAFDQFLDDISRCFIQRDLALWRKRMELPLSIISRHGMVELSTEEAVAENFGLYLQACDMLKLDSINRSIVNLEDCGDGTFLGTYLTMLMSRGELAAEPYESSVILSMKHKEFRMTSVMNGRGHAEWTGVTDR